MSQTSAVGTGIIHHTHERGTASYTIQCAEDNADKVTKFCYGEDHLVLLKTNTIQAISSNDSFSDIYPLLQQLNTKCPFIDIAFGRHHGLALDSQHRVYSFGDNKYGQLGVGSIATRQSFTESIEPLLITYFEKVNQCIVAIACGSNHCLALSRSGDIYSWGDSRRGQLGNNVLSLQMLPRCIAHLPSMQSIACGPDRSAAVSRTGVLYQWGDGKPIPGAVKLPDPDPESAVQTAQCEDVEDQNNDGNPKNNENPKFYKVTKVALGMTHSLCLTECGQLMGWGLSTNGSLGSILSDKMTTTPAVIPDFSGSTVVDIECFGQCSVIQVENKGIYIMGFNDHLFDGITHRIPFHVPLGDQLTVECFGCSRNDFVMLTATSISTVTPTIATAAGTEMVISGDGMYRTSHSPTVRFVIQSATDEPMTLIQDARFMESTDDSNALCVVVDSPDLSGYALSALTLPTTAQMAIALDGCHFSADHSVWIVPQPDHDHQFEITPQCGDIGGNAQCIISSPTEYISSIAAKVKLEDIKIRFVGKHKLSDTDSDDTVDTVSAAMTDHGQIECMTPAMARGLYSVEMAIDGQRFHDIECAFRSYKVECTQCIPNTIDLSKYGADDKSVDLELKVYGFLPIDSSKVAMKCMSLSGDHGISEWLYESQSARNIHDEELKNKKEAEGKREEFKRKEMEELEALKQGQGEEEEAHNERVSKMEKEKKKKKKAAEVEEWETAMKQEMDEWAERLSERAKAQREITRKYKKEMMFLDKKEAQIPKQEEVDPDGEGFISCKVDSATLREWKTPSDVQVMITLNGSLFSTLWTMPLIHPRIKQMAPRLGLLSESTTIRMVLEGFELNDTVDEEKGHRFKVTVRENAAGNEEEKEEKEITDGIEVESDDESGCTVITVKVSGLSTVGEAVITLKYGTLFEIPCSFLVHDMVKITGVSPKELSVDGPGKMTVQCANMQDIDGQFVDQIFVRINGNEKSMTLMGSLVDDECGIEVKWDGEQQSMATIGAAKKAQIEVSLNEQQWITAKATVSIK